MDMKCTPIKDLLKDVNQFMTVTLANESLSIGAQAQKDALLQRLSTYIPETSVSTSSYIVMNGSSKNGGDQCEEYVLASTNPDNTDGEFYEEFPEQREQQQLDDNQQSSVNYENVSIPISKLREVAKKFGPLYRKGKFLFMEHESRCWGGILGDMLFIYNSDKDIKPSSIVHVRGYEARPAPTYCPKDAKKRECCFEIVCPGKKSLQFIARTVKDMEQWLAYINEASQRTATSSYLFEDQGGGTPLKKRQLPSPPNSSSESEEYDDIHHIDQNNEEEIYHDISDIKLDLQSSHSKDILSSPATTHKPPDHNDSADADLVYDDICANNPSSVYYNMANQRTGNEAEDKLGEGNKLGYDDDKDDDNIYDDIGIIGRGPEIPRSRHTGNADTGNSIQFIANKLEATLSNNKRNMFNKILPDTSFGNSVPSDDLYEPIDTPNDEAHT